MVLSWLSVLVMTFIELRYGGMTGLNPGEIGLMMRAAVGGSNTHR